MYDVPAGALAEAIGLAVRAPSVHNTQPWRWRIGDGAPGTVELYADPGRHLSATDPDRRDLLLSCGAALHHLVVALAGRGHAVRVARMPDPEDSIHLATVTVVDGRPDPVAADLFPAIRLRHTDRRRFSHRPVPRAVIEGLVGAAARADVLLAPVDRARDRFVATLADAASRQRWTPGYMAELQLWTRRPGAARDGVPASAVAAPAEGLASGPGMRRFPRAGLAQPLPPPGHGLPDDAAAYLLLATVDDGPVDRLRAGEALSAVLLTATREGLATTPLSQAVEIAVSREVLRRIVGLPEHPQLLLRVGWPATLAGPLADTPRRDVAAVLRCV
jgi:nitroreductase